MKAKILRKGKILILILIFALFLISYGSSLAKIRVFFSLNGGIAEEVIKQIENAQEHIDIAMYCFTSEPIAEAKVEAENRGVEIHILMDEGQSQGKYSEYQFFLDNGIAIIQNKYAEIIHD